MSSILTRRWKGLRRRQVITLAGHRLELPAAHDLPKIRAQHPQYESEIGRLAEFLLNRQRRLAMIDVGANVGDTVASIPCGNSGSFLCIEASPKFFAFLQRNLGSLSNVECIHAIVTEPDELSATTVMIESAGTGHLEPSRGSAVAATTPRRTLDQIIAENDRFSAPNFLKIDTDGYEMKVLRGSEEVVQTCRPAIHFELSFRHWKKVSGTSWKDAARFLASYGYHDCLLYDNVGYLIGTDRFRESSLLPAMEAYALRRDHFYLNVITMHSGSPDWEDFKKTELHHPSDSQPNSTSEACR